MPWVSHIGDVHPHAILNLCDAEEIAAVIRDQESPTAHRTQIHQPVRQMTADEAQSPVINTRLPENAPA